jgi:hypothetical protein
MEAITAGLAILRQFAEPQAIRAAVNSGHELADHFWNTASRMRRASKKTTWPRPSLRSSD